MNKIVKSVVISSLYAMGGLFTLQQSAHAVGSAGCGLGSILFTDNTWWKQLLAVTTIGTSFSQTFGITSGTSNCASGVFGQIQKQKDFVAANLASLQREAAQGSGDSLNGLASVLGCPASQYGSFGAFTQTHYKTVFNNDSSDAVLGNVKSQISQSKTLFASCSLARI